MSRGEVWAWAWVGVSCALSVGCPVQDFDTELGTRETGSGSAQGQSGFGGTGGAAGGGEANASAEAGRTDGPPATSTGGTPATALDPGVHAEAGSSGVASGVSGDAGGSDAIPAPEARSCAEGLRCGSDSCCATLRIEALQFTMGMEDASEQNASPKHEVSVSGFYLDKFEVSVGRMEAFLDAYDEWRLGGHPTETEGAHPHLPDSGWGWALSAITDGSDPLPASAAELETRFGCHEQTTWTVGDPKSAVNCVNWFEAFAFCIWDNGRLPTEAEWEAAAAGGAEERLYPWGSEDPTHERANYSGSNYGEAVGSHQSLGNGRWGHADLAGSMSEWVLDAYDPVFYERVGDPCADCASLDASTESRVARGGGWAAGAPEIRVSVRRFGLPADRSRYSGFRCARDR